MADKKTTQMGKRGGYRSNAGRKPAHKSGPKVTLSLKLAAPIRSHLQTLAAEDGRSLSNMTETLIERAWKRRKKQDQNADTTTALGER